jgi:hypothetical protein
MRTLTGIMSATTCNGGSTLQHESLVDSDSGIKQLMLLNTINAGLFGRGWPDSSCRPIE